MGGVSAPAIAAGSARHIKFRDGIKAQEKYKAITGVMDADSSDCTSPAWE